MVGIAAGGQAGKIGGIAGMLAGYIPLDGMARDMQERRSAAGVAERLAQPQQRLREVMEGSGVALVGPEQPTQAGAAVWPLGLNGQVDQQRPHFVAAEAADWHIVDLSLKRPQEGQREYCHHLTSAGCDRSYTVVRSTPATAQALIIWQPISDLSPSAVLAVYAPMASCVF